MRAVLLRTTLVILASAALGVAAFAAPAGASPRGTNGQITYDINGGNGVGVVTANPDGSSARLLVPGSCCGGFSPDGSKLAVPYMTAAAGSGLPLLTRTERGTRRSRSAIPR